MIRVIITKVYEAAIKLLDATGRPDETFTGREFMEHYGFTGFPKPGAQGVMVEEGNHFIVIASDDARYRISLQEGEVAIYDDLGQKAHLTREGIVASSPTKITASAPEIDINGSGVVNVVSPEINLGSATRAALYRLMDERLIAIYNGHTHNDPQGGATGVPNQQLTLAGSATNITRAI